MRSNSKHFNFKVVIGAALVALLLSLAGCPEWFEPEPAERTAPRAGESPTLACQPNCAGAYLVEANLVDAKLSEPLAKVAE